MPGVHACFVRPPDHSPLPFAKSRRALRICRVPASCAGGGRGQSPFADPARTAGLLQGARNFPAHPRARRRLRIQQGAPRRSRCLLLLPRTPTLSQGAVVGPRRDNTRHGWRGLASMDGFTACPGEAPRSRHTRPFVRDSSRKRLAAIAAPTGISLKGWRCRGGPRGRRLRVGPCR